MSNEASRKTSRKALEAEHSSKKSVVDEQTEFESWLAHNRPSGDVESVQRQWYASGDYADFRDATNPAPPPAEPTVTQPLSTERITDENSVEYWKSYAEAGVESFNLMMIELTALRAQQVTVPARESLSDGLIDAVTLDQWGEMQGYPLAAHRTYARAIEAAHGIAPQGDKA